MGKRREYELEIGLAYTNPTLSVSARAPPDVATIIVLREGTNPACPWTLFSVQFGEAVSAQDVAEGVDQQHGVAPRERSREESERTGKRTQGLLCVLLEEQGRDL